MIWYAYITVIRILNYVNGVDLMPLVYKSDVLAALKEKGYNTTRLRRDKLLAEGVIQSLRAGKPISWANIAKICEMLNCQPGDLLEYIPDK